MYRQWNKPYWSVNKKYAIDLAELVAIYYNVSVQLPDYSNYVPAPEIDVVMVEYIGYCKPRTGNIPSPSAYASVNGGWNVLFPEDVLKAFFNQAGGGSFDIDESSSYYAILGITDQAAQDDIKKAFRRLSRQWHPDVCRESGAEEMFKRINDANQVLSDPQKRRKYNAARRIERDASKGQPQDLMAEVYTTYGNQYRSPFRCGLVTIEYVPMGNKAIVTKILAWDDIVGSDGKIMTSFWSMDLETYVINWI
jgi:hypothetical protein